MSKWLRHPLVQILFIGIVLAFIGRHLANQWSHIRAESFSINPVMLGLAQLGFIAGLLILPGGGWLVARAMNTPVTKAAMWHAFSLGMVAKYLPGSVWSLPSRAVLYKGLGITRHLEVVYWETGLTVVAAALVALSALPLLSRLDIFLPILLLIGGGSVAFLVGSWLLKRGWLHTLQLQLDAPTMLAALLVYVITWAVIGCSFMLMVRAAGGAWNGHTVGLFAGGWAVGFLSFLTPGGIGVRDGVLIVGVGLFATEPIPLIAAALARLCWTVAELVALSFAYYNKRRETHHPDSVPQ